VRRISPSASNTVQDFPWATPWRETRIGDETSGVAPSSLPRAFCCSGPPPPCRTARTRTRRVGVSRACAAASYADRDRALRTSPEARREHSAWKSSAHASARRAASRCWCGEREHRDRNRFGANDASVRDTNARWVFHGSSSGQRAGEERARR
jgi:hypothetical protein